MQKHWQECSLCWRKSPQYVNAGKREGREKNKKQKYQHRCDSGNKLILKPIPPTQDLAHCVAEDLKIEAITIGSE